MLTPVSSQVLSTANSIQFQSVHAHCHTMPQSLVRVTYMGSLLWPGLV